MASKNLMVASSRAPARFVMLRPVLALTAVFVSGFSANVQALAIVSSDIHAAVIGSGLGISVIPHAGEVISTNFFLGGGRTDVRAGGVDMDLHIDSLQVQATPPRPDERLAEVSTSLRAVSLDFVNSTDEDQEATITVVLNWDLSADTNANYHDETAVAEVSFSGLKLSQLGSSISYSYPISALYSLHAESRLIHGIGGIEDSWTARLDPNPSFSFLIPKMTTLTWSIDASTGGSVFSSIPSPATATLVGLGLAGLSFTRRKAKGGIAKYNRSEATAPRRPAC